MSRADRATLAAADRAAMPSSPPIQPHPVRVFLHGTPLAPSVWNDVVRLLPGTNVVPNLTPAVLAADDSRPLQRVVAEAILDAVPDGRLHAVGHSFGGQVALELALCAPERVEKLTVLCSRHVPFPSFTRLSTDLTAGLLPDTETTLRRWFTATDLAYPSPVVERIRQQLTSADTTAWAAAIRAIADYDRADSVGTTGIPTLLVCAGLDPVSGPAVMERFAADMPGATLHTTSRWAHMSAFLEPAVVAQMILHHERSRPKKA